MSNLHIYLSTACQHEAIDGDSDLHMACRETCKFCDAPCACTRHPDGTDKVTTWIDQARDMARVLLVHALGSGTMTRELEHKIRTDPALFWLRGEEQPAGIWHPA